jgi:hypothetical protein
MDMRIVLIAVAAACGPYADPIAPDGNAECGSQKLGVLMGLYAAELDTTCRPHGSLEECAGPELDRVKAKWAKKFDAWRDCE